MLLRRDGRTVVVETTTGDLEMLDSVLVTSLAIPGDSEPKK